MSVRKEAARFRQDCPDKMAHCHAIGLTDYANPLAGKGDR